MVEDLREEEAVVEEAGAGDILIDLLRSSYN